MDNFWMAVGIGLVAVFAMLDSRLLGRLNFEQPLITSAIIGCVLGNPAAGLAAGATIELMSMGLVQVGAAVPPDMVLGGIVATAFSILTGSDPETAVAIAVPIAVLGQLLGVVFRTILASLTHLADRAIAEGHFRMATNYHIVWGTILYSVMYFVPVFFAIYLGTDFVQIVVDNIPEWLTNGLNLAAKFLTAYGLALLLSMMVGKGMMVFFLVGFFACVYMNITVIGISIFGVLLAIVMLGIKFKNPSLFATEAADAGGGVDALDDDYDPLEDDDD